VSEFFILNDWFIVNCENNCQSREGPICKFYKGIYFDKWDGSDFFTPHENYRIFVTKKAADVLQKNKITNMRIQNSVEIEIDVDNVLKK